MIIINNKIRPTEMYEEVSYWTSKSLSSFLHADKSAVVQTQREYDRNWFPVDLISLQSLVYSKTVS